MKRVFYIIVMLFFFAGCASSLYPDYTLTKKYPRDIPDLELKILTDTTGIILQKEDESIKQDFRFIKKKKNFLVITYINDTHNLVSLKKGDTVVYYKKELYLINEKHKLVFNKKE
ncbi:hypothetical protein [Empedobacter brevis]|uniref:hypothetical protein n=2 Tax=Empedobacter brevis TaxID=247 RepID=UPI0012B64F1E|nr:hypothetical protein [Empedobacter brevis]